MAETINAVYEDGVFRPEIPQNLPNCAAVRLTIEAEPPALTDGKPHLTGAEVLAIISKSWKKFNPNTDRPGVTSENVDQILYGSGGPGDVR
jgi:predicted DNA-binding antitoxin AbrB/MazE fold protein